MTLRRSYFQYITALLRPAERDLRGEGTRYPDYDRSIGADAVPPCEQAARG
jgi:hypothetical protein